MKEKKGRKYYYRVKSVKIDKKVSKERIYLGANLNKEDLKRIRKEFQIDSKEFRDIINNKNFKKVWGDLKGEELVSSPMGFSKDDPNIDLIKKKMYLFSINFTNSDVLKNNFSDKITSSFKDISPFFNYMSYVLTTDLNGESII